MFQKINKTREEIRATTTFELQQAISISTLSIERSVC